MAENLKTQEGAPKFKRRPTVDAVIENNNNSTIVLGLDRPPKTYKDDATLDDAKTGTATIDIIVGRAARDPNYNDDDARILLSRKTDGDSNFGLKSGSDGFLTEEQELDNQDGNSYGVIKADTIRIIAREDIRLQSQNSGASLTIRPSGDIVINTDGNIKIGSKDATEPVVLGERLKSVLETLIDQIVSHTHIGNMGAPTSPPVNAAGFTSLKAGTISNKDILADNVFSEKNNA